MLRISLKMYYIKDGKVLYKKQINKLAHYKRNDKMDIRLIEME